MLDLAVDDTSSDRRTSSIVERSGRWAPAVAVALPIVVATVVAVAHGWSPVADQAGEVSRIAEVGTRRTPLIGPFSRGGWSHPGPLLFWVCAPGWRLYGPAGVLATVGLVNAGAAALAPVLARRVAGAAFGVAVAAVLLVLELSIGPAGLVDVWNPYVGTIVLVTGLLALAAVVRRTDWALPVAVGALSWAVQAHVGPALTVAAAALTAGAFLLRQRRLPERRWLVAAVVIAGLAWSGPAINQMTGDPGNLSTMVSDLTASTVPRPALTTSLRITASHLGLVPAWARGGGGAYNTDAPIWTLLVPVAGLALTGVAARRRDDVGLAVMAAITGPSFVAAVAATTRIDLTINTYLYRWTWAVGALAWAVIGVGVWREITTWEPSHLLRRTTSLAGITLLVAALGVSIAGGVDEEQVPLENQSEAAADLLGQLRSELPRDGAYVVVIRGGLDFGGVATGLGVTLTTEGYDVAFGGVYRDQLGGHHIATDDDGRRRLEILATTTIEPEAPTPGATLLATHDPLTRTERDRVAALEREIREQVDDDTMAPDASISAGGFGGAALIIAGADPTTVEALDELTSRGHRFTVWLAP